MADGRRLPITDEEQDECEAHLEFVGDCEGCRHFRHTVEVAYCALEYSDEQKAEDAHCALQGDSNA